MLPDQDWCNVYPTAAPFKPSAVPLPVRMGYPVKRGVPPEKTGNLELVKIPNFLHLMPVAIRNHCAALKEFCTQWPSALSSDELSEKHFPIEFQTVDYVSAGPSLRNPKARVVSMQVKLSSLNLDDHSRKKFIKLAGSRYNAANDTLTLRSDRILQRVETNTNQLQRINGRLSLAQATIERLKGNKKAIKKTEAWESEKEESDMEEFTWEGSRSEKSALETLLRGRFSSTPQEQILQNPTVQQYRSAELAQPRRAGGEY
ncbi:28S ribosomal protein S35, mitochondrial isoform X3 [Xenopus laevis]|uniref:28S ribosomal protein S35, mitochondrial isoform X3 n=1 Tax=Xenopus laevis TaxID=8355 RepID=A0A8J1MSC5_XENLA|nr:28S ribosomal protein S35, mitochondrial isoform X3 [Xenopus laevis]